VTAEPKIVPRWEWRTFARAFGGAEHVLAEFEPEPARESDETYLVSLHSNASVKLRDDLVDVKRLERVDDAGLELWKPVLKAPFPLATDDVAAVLSALGVAVPDLRRGAYTREEFAAEFVVDDPALLVIPVHKHRTHYLVDGCMVELTQIGSRSRSIRTIAIESPDPDLVNATIERLGLHGRENVSVARGLKALVGLGGHRDAVIDVGTNSVKFFLGERGADGTTRTIADRAEVTRLGEGLEASGALSEEAIRRTVAAIAGMCDEARRANADVIAIVGTAGLRSARNRGVFDAELHARTKRAIEIIDGEEEGRLAYLAAIAAVPASDGRLVVFDSGGGSTQFTFGRAGHVEERFSVDVGAVRVAERFGLADAVPAEEVQGVLDALTTELGVLRDRPAPDAVIAMGGTVTNLAAVKHALAEYDATVVNGTVLDLAEIDRQIACYRALGSAQRREIVGLQPARAEVILGGACIVRTVLTSLRRDSLTVSDRGVRHGVFIERFT
jgi:exopolyphosphatase/guanosine-5'-triphosphate,3'-diphosphate pyrophosphatase